MFLGHQLVVPLSLGSLVTSEGNTYFSGESFTLELASGLITSTTTYQSSYLAFLYLPFPPDRLVVKIK